MKDHRFVAGGLEWRAFEVRHTPGLAAYGPELTGLDTRAGGKGSPMGHVIDRATLGDEIAKLECEIHIETEPLHNGDPDSSFVLDHLRRRLNDASRAS